MALAKVLSRAAVGISAPPVVVEVHLSRGLPSFSIVGLPETAVKESKDRVRSALLNSQFEFPPRRITVNLAPADLPKEGARYDLAIALGILCASGQINQNILNDYEIIGELGLDGSLRACHGVVPFVLAASKAKHKLIIPSANANEASLIKTAHCISTDHLLKVCAHLQGVTPLTPIPQKPITQKITDDADLSDVHGQFHAKRALEVAAAGAHNLIMIGPPGSGKTMLASRLLNLLPLLSEEEMLETAMINSISQHKIDWLNWGRRPYRHPHHTSSAVALVGGGSLAKPGEISLAHNGVLFLDELPEFDRKVLEGLREPLESGTISISRAARQAQYPARFQLIAAMNPCPCGHHGDSNANCHCSLEQINRYKARISGPLLDRIDLHIEVPALPVKELHKTHAAESSADVAKRVAAARALQMQRSNKTNQALRDKEIKHYCALKDEDAELLQQAMTKLKLSARAYHRILKVARTIADLAACENIESTHLHEAINYRKMDRAL
ncbi:MAG: YifB family Mg chelatase-like AAA ATPase [Thiotrichales bacterium]|nr:YifB family Mg chelatase-like AAA ATPase [Thiotrichales bacterium]